MVRIESVRARQVLDSRANPTVQCELSTPDGVFTAIVPSGASTGKHEALELRDGGRQFSGKGVLKAVGHVNSLIAGKINGREFASQDELDNLLIEMDGTENKSRLGANAMLSVSMAFSRAIAAEQGVVLFESLGETSGNIDFALPVPQLNVINGGKHVGRENDIQEHMFFPVKFSSFSEALRAGVESYHALKGMLRKKLGEQATLLGDEGGFAPKIENVEDRLELMLKAIEEAGYEGRITLGLDCASSEFYSGRNYRIGRKTFSAEKLVNFYSSLVETYKIASLEDGMAEDDWEGWAMLNSALGGKVQVVGDDLLVTNPGRIVKAIEKDACNALLLKVNQIGTVTESIQAAKLAKADKWNVIVSHRSGESEDAFISDLVVGIGAGQSKFGAPARSERAAKYNRLLRIEEYLSQSGRAKFSGKLNV